MNNNIINTSVCVSDSCSIYSCIKDIKIKLSEYLTDCCASRISEYTTAIEAIDTCALSMLAVCENNKENTYFMPKTNQYSTINININVENIRSIIDGLSHINEVLHDHYFDVINCSNSDGSVNDYEMNNIEIESELLSDCICKLFNIVYPGIF